MQFNQKAQQVIEYLLLIAIVVLVVLSVAGSPGAMKNAVEQLLNSTVKTINTK